MSGHSKWANIKHRKARVDAQRGKIFTRLGKSIIAAARQGGGDPEANSTLKMAIAKAREANMPMDTINKAILRATGELEGVNLEEVSYEGYAPGGVAVLLNVLTDNKNRTAAEVRHIFAHCGGNLGESGCVSWMFEMKGFIVIPKEGLAVDGEELMLSLIESGADDLKEEEESFEVVMLPQNMEKVMTVLKDEGVAFSLAEITMLPNTTVEIKDKETAGKVLRMMDALEDHDDIQQVYANFDIPEEIIEQISS